MLSRVCGGQEILSSLSAWLRKKYDSSYGYSFRAFAMLAVFFFYVKKAFFPSNCWFSGFMFLTMMVASTFVRRAECLQPQLWGYIVITPLLFAGCKWQNETVKVEDVIAGPRLSCYRNLSIPEPRGDEQTFKAVRPQPGSCCPVTICFSIIYLRCPNGLHLSRYSAC